MRYFVIIVYFLITIYFSFHSTLNQIFEQFKDEEHISIV